MSDGFIPACCEAEEQQVVVDGALLDAPPSCPGGPPPLSMPGATMIWSLPVELSLASTIDCFEPPDTDEMVSLRVWLLPSRLPVARALRESV